MCIPLLFIFTVFTLPICSEFLYVPPLKAVLNTFIFILHFNFCVSASFVDQSRSYDVPSIISISQLLKISLYTLYILSPFIIFQFFSCHISFNISTLTICSGFLYMPSLKAALNSLTIYNTFFFLHPLLIRISILQALSSSTARTSITATSCLKYHLLHAFLLSLFVYFFTSVIYLYIFVTRICSGFLSAPRPKAVLNTVIFSNIFSPTSSSHSYVSIS